MPRLYQGAADRTCILINKEGEVIGRWVGSSGKGIDEKLVTIFDK